MRKQFVLGGVKEVDRERIIIWDGPGNMTKAEIIHRSTPHYNFFKGYIVFNCMIGLFHALIALDC